MAVEVQGVGATVEAEAVDDVGAASTARRLPVDDHHACATPADQLGGGQPGQPGTDHHHIGLDHFHAISTLAAAPL